MESQKLRTGDKIGAWVNREEVKWNGHRLPSGQCPQMDFLHLTLHRAPVAEMAIVHWIVHTPSLHFPVSLAIRLGHVTCCSQSKWGYCVSLPDQEAIYFLHSFCSLPWQSWRPCAPEDYKVKDRHQKKKKKCTCWTWNFMFWSTMSNCLLQKLHIIYSQKQCWKVPVFCILPIGGGHKGLLVIFHLCHVIYEHYQHSLASPAMMWNSSSWWQRSSKPAQTVTVQLTQRIGRNYKCLIL